MLLVKVRIIWISKCANKLHTDCVQNSALTEANCKMLFDFGGRWIRTCCFFVCVCTFFFFFFKSRTPLLFDYVITRHRTALWEMIEAYGEYQHFLPSRPGLSERAVSLAAVFFSQYFLLPSIAPYGLQLKYLPAISVTLPGKYSHGLS